MPFDFAQGKLNVEFSQLNSPLTLLITNYICDNK